MPDAALTTLVWDHLAFLAGDIGPRVVGSPENERAARHVESAFSAAGLAVTPVPFPAPAWEGRGAILLADGAAVPAFLNTFSPPARVEGPALACVTLRDLEDAALAGRVVVLAGEVSRGALGRLGNPYHLPDLDRRIGERLRDGGALAAVFVAPRFGPLELATEDWALGLPAVTVTPETGARLLEAQRVALSVQATPVTPGTARHVLGRLGSGPGVAVMAHFDGRGPSPAALDNATGTAALLAQAARLPGGGWPFALELVAFNGEEYGLGEPEYLAARGPLDDLLLAVNLDAVGPRLGANTAASIGAPDWLDEWLDGGLAARPGWTRVPPWVQSNHFTFTSRGVPAIALGSTGLTDQMHTPGDTLPWVDPRRVAEAVELVEDLLTGVAANVERLDELRAERQPATPAP
ncbi:MAG TPA: M28 family peptidase [Deinococcales bacterium]|nr:M28 family peptidase [Deinococcales bacterium]